MPMIDLSPFQAILITGVSGSGKSELARKLRGENHDFSIFPMDVVLDALDLAQLTLGAPAADGHQRSIQMMQALGPALCESVFNSGAPTIIEGGWIEPEAWQRLIQSNNRIAALFLGYPAASPDQLLARLSSTAHWLSGGQGGDFLNDEIEHSKALQTQVASLPCAAFVDVSAGYVKDDELADHLKRLATSTYHLAAHA